MARRRSATRGARGAGAVQGGCKQRANPAPVFSPSSDVTTCVMAAGAVTPSKLVATAQEHKEEWTCEQDQQPLAPQKRNLSRRRVPGDLMRCAHLCSGQCVARLTEAKDIREDSLHGVHQVGQATEWCVMAEIASLMLALTVCRGPL